MSNSTSRPDLSFLFSLLLLYYIIIINFVVGFSRPLRNVWTDYWSCRKNSETIDPWSDWLPKYCILFGIEVTQIPGQHFKVSRVNPWSDYWSTPFQKLMVEFSGLSDLFEDHLWRFWRLFNGQSAAFKGKSCFSRFLRRISSHNMALSFRIPFKRPLFSMALRERYGRTSSTGPYGTYL